MTTYTIFGAGPGGLYTAWRLATGGKLAPGDQIRLVEWGRYAFEGEAGTRRPAGRICSHNYGDDPANSYIEVGGMRYRQWDEGTREGHLLVTRTIAALGLNDKVTAFMTTDDPLFYLRGVNFYSSQLNDYGFRAPYNTDAALEPPDNVYDRVSKILTDGSDVETRAEQCGFYATGTLSSNVSSVVFDPGTVVSNIGYWNIFYDQVGNESFNYAADGGGYSSNVINWNAANAAVYNGEFEPGGAFKTLKDGYSELFFELHRQARAAADRAGIGFSLTQGQRLHSIWLDGDVPTFRTASADDPDHGGAALTSDYVFMAMPRHCIDLVAQATRYADMGASNDFLNHPDVQNYLESVLEQPSYKVAMFFDRQWWKEVAYPPRVDPENHTYGPTITDVPLRQIYYFGDNSEAATGEVYGMLASYDDMRFAGFWRDMELPLSDRCTTAISRDLQPLEGARTAPQQMVNMLKLQLAKVHYNDANKAHLIPDPLETVFMDWGLNPFGCGYHAWAAHYDIGDVMQRLRSPGRMAGATGDRVFIVGSAFSNDQAWVEGAFTTAESVLVEFLGLETIGEPDVYPLICRGGGCG